MSDNGLWRAVYHANALFRLARNIDYMATPRRYYPRQRHRYYPMPERHHNGLVWLVIIVVIVWAPWRRPSLDPGEAVGVGYRGGDGGRVG